MSDGSDVTRVRASGSQHTAEIVVAIDRSGRDQGCLTQGLKIASALNVRLEAVTAWSDDSDTIIQPGESLWAEEQAAELLVTAANGLFGAVWPDWFHVSSRQGDVVRVLIDKSKEAELLIVGSRQHVPLSSRLRQSVGILCVKHAHCSVLVVHDPDHE